MFVDVQIKDVLDVLEKVFVLVGNKQVKFYKMFQGQRRIQVKFYVMLMYCVGVKENKEFWDWYVVVYEVDG